MPTSNGQITTFDIRRDAIVESHISDESVATDAVQSLAVTVAEEATPVSVVSVGDAADDDLSTTWVNPVTLAITVPAWAGQMDLTGMGFTRVVPGADRIVSVAVKIEDADPPFGSGNRETVLNGDISAVYLPFIKGVVVTPGATVNVYYWAQVDNGTITTVFHLCYATAVFTR